MGIADPEDPADYLGAAQAMAGDVSIAWRDEATLETTFSFAQPDGSDTFVTITDVIAGNDDLFMIGDVDGVNFTGRVERAEDRVAVTINPEVLGIGLSPRRMYFVIRKPVPASMDTGTVTVGGTGTQHDVQGATYELFPTLCGEVCKCVPGSGGACSSDDCDVAEDCTPGPGICEWKPKVPGSTSASSVAIVILGAIIAIGVVKCRRESLG